jgi:hypothetical protein
MAKQKLIYVIVALVSFGLGFAARQFLPFNVNNRNQAVQLLTLIGNSEGQVKDALFKAAAIASVGSTSAAQQLVNSAKAVNDQRTAVYYQQLRQNLQQYYK